MRLHLVLGATATAVALVACTRAAPASREPSAPVGTDDTGTGLVLDVPDDFVLDHAEGDEALWLGPATDDGTRVGITAVRLCAEPRPTWEDLAAAAERGEHTGWTDYVPTAPPVPVRVAGATTALRARGTVTLPTARTGEEVPVVHDEVLLRDPAGTVHRLRVEGAADTVAALDLDGLFASVAVAEPGCPA